MQGSHTAGGWKKTKGNILTSSKDIFKHKMKVLTH
jgi:hypothetical protein